jgi:hypothetical protein
MVSPSALYARSTTPQTRWMARMGSASSSVCRSVRHETGLGTSNIRACLEGKERREVVWLVDYHGLESVSDRRTAGDDWFEVDDCMGEGGEVKGLAGYFECGTEGVVAVLYGRSFGPVFGNSRV